VLVWLISIGFSIKDVVLTSAFDSTLASMTGLVKEKNPMNERIRLLAEQATTYIEPTSNSGEGWIFDKEKFALLIVKECADRVSKMVMRDKFDFIPQDPHSQGWNDAVEYASKELKKSLGVES
jgi:hypothetical protein